MTTSPRALIGGVGYRWLGDASFGLAVTDALAQTDLARGVEVADLGYGALHVAMDLGDARPPYDRVVLVAAVARGREPGQLYPRRWEGALPDAAEIQERLREAGAGVIDLEHLLVVAEHFGALPDDVLVAEFEPVDITTGARLSAAATGCLPDAVRLVLAEAVRPVAARGGSSDPGLLQHG